MSGARRAAAIVAAALACSACFSYVPAALDTVPPGDEVRVHLTREGVAAELAAASRQPDQSVEGTIVGSDRDRLILRVPVALQTAGFMTRSLGQDVTIPADRIAQLERRELNRARTGLAFAGGLATLATVLLSFGQGVPEPELPPRQEPEELRPTGWGISIALPFN